MFEAVLAAGEITSSPLVVALAAGIPTATLGYLGLRQTERRDREAAKAAVLAAEGPASQEVLDGVRAMFALCRSDNAGLREEATRLRAEVAAWAKRAAELEAQADDPAP